MMDLPVFTCALRREDFGVLALAQVYAIFMAGIANFCLLAIYKRNVFSTEKKESQES